MPYYDKITTLPLLHSVLKFKTADTPVDYSLASYAHVSIVGSMCDTKSIISSAKFRAGPNIFEYKPSFKSNLQFWNAISRLMECFSRKRNNKTRKRPNI